MVVKDKSNVVVLGGGTGMPVLLKGLKEYPINLTAVVTVADDGGSTGRIRETIDVPAPGDIRNVIAALSNVDEDLYELFQYRISGNNGLKGHSLGNLLLVATNEITRDFTEAVKKVAQLFNVKADILPVVNESVRLHAEMEDGTIVSGESNIPCKNKKIKRVFITPNRIKANKDVVKALSEADLIVISPGSLYTSIMPNLIIRDVANALKKAKAPIVYVCNMMTQRGETNDYTASDHVKAIHRHVGEEIIDIIIVNNSPIKEELALAYEKERAYPVKIDREELAKMNIEIIEDELFDESVPFVRHNYKKVAKLIYRLVDHDNE